jgi:RiboL-PSP-HEPN
MRNRELTKQYNQIKKLIEKAKTLPTDDFELQGHWGRYLCVLVSGFLENAISEVYIAFVSKSASPHVVRYTVYLLNRIQNPKAKKFIETAQSFKAEWGSELERYFLDDPSRKNAIDTIMSNRHQIAHGKDSNISVSKVSQHLEKCVETIRFIENQCDNIPNR